MICPNCRLDRKRKERTGNRCSNCRFVFAFDPKTNKLKLHDLRFRAVVEKVRGPDGLSYSADQLRFAAARKVQAEKSSAVGFGCGVAVVVVVGAILTVMLAVEGLPAAGVVGAGVVVVLGLMIAFRFATAERRRYPGPPVTAAQFAGLLSRWRQVYGESPAGLLPPGPATVVTPTGPPRAVLHCPDPETVRFLAAAGLAERHPVVLVPSEPGAAVRQAAHDRLPILVLHDADPAGCLLAARLRAALPGATVLDVGLRPRAAMRVGPAVRVKPAPELLEELAAAPTGLAADEIGWLADGCVLPLPAVRPAKLLRAVERAVERAVADPDDRRARAIGFLSEPAPR